MNKNNAFPLFSGSSPKEVWNDLKLLVNIPQKGLSLQKIQTLLHNHLLPHLLRYDHPGFLSMFNAFPEKGAHLGAEIALSYNQGVTNWYVSPGGATLEELCIKTMCELFELEKKHRFYGASQ